MSRMPSSNPSWKKSSRERRWPSAVAVRLRLERRQHVPAATHSSSTHAPAPPASRSSALPPAAVSSPCEATARELTGRGALVSTERAAFTDLGRAARAVGYDDQQHACAKKQYTCA